MPYIREGAIKVSSHHVRSPLLSINRSCQTCHRYPEEELRARAESIQDRTQALMDRAEIACVDLIKAIERRSAAEPMSESLDKARKLHRQAQFRLDFVAAENSMGFHAPQESARILGEAIDLARQGQIAAMQEHTSTNAPTPASGD
jgi:nitrite reductase (cytochrome c-552)